MPTKNGYLIVLTGEIATISDYHGATTVGFINALPENYFKSFIKYEKGYLPQGYRTC